MRPDATLTRGPYRGCMAIATHPRRSRLERLAFHVGLGPLVILRDGMVPSGDDDRTAVSPPAPIRGRMARGPASRASSRRARLV